MMLHLSDGNCIAVGKSDKKQKSSQRTHKVTFMDYDNNVLKTEIVLQNKNATPPMVKERDVIDKNLSPLLPLIANEKITIKH